MASTTTSIRQLRKALRQAADPLKAPAMRAYMKSQMPYHGVPAPLLRNVFRSVFADVEFGSAGQWRGQVLDLWRNARYREERYGALHLAGHRLALPFQTPVAMRLYEELIVSGAWWDYVDDIASHRVGPILRAYPAPMRRRMLAWSRSPNLWKRRTSIICQLGSKADTDLGLLYACIEPSLEAQEFFLRKAIGWALRQYAWTDPAEVRRYVRRNHDRLSPLSRREALKNIGAVAARAAGARIPTGRV
ncbi:MAG TPA: DNA alkylation repair protein [Steroidobacteraceae bacterium]|nr:DNA alkylation repair protein [Steroidobacteraceae bacterium]